MHPFVFDRLTEIADREEIPYSVQAAPRASRTDADGIFLVRTGVPTGLVSIPNRYMHTQVEVVSLTDSFVKAGKGTSADNSRILVIANQLQQHLVTSEAELRIASARLATILQLDPPRLYPEMGLAALDADPLPVNLTGTNFDLNSTIQRRLGGAGLAELRITGFRPDHGTRNGQ